MPKATAKAKTRSKPTAKQQVATFKPIAFSEETIMVKGGFTTKDRPAIVRTVEEADGSRAQFLKVTKQQDWLFAAAFGDNWRQADDTQRNVVDEFRSQIRQYSDGVLALPTDNDIEELDPMDSIGCDTSSDASPSKKKGQGMSRMRYYRNLAIGKVVHVNMRVSETSPEVHQIRVYCADRKTIWIHKDDVEWVVKMLARQLSHSNQSVVASGT